MNRKINQFIYLTKQQFGLYLGIAISIFLFILFFQPFAPNNFEFENKLLFLAGFGLILIVSLFLSQIVFQGALIKKEYDQDNNIISISLYSIFLITITTLAFVFYIRYVGQIIITFNVVVRVIFICLTLPVTLILKFKLNFYQSRFIKLLQETRAMHDKLKQFSQNYANKHIEIVSENESDNFRIQVSDIVYIKSADNYVEIGYIDEEQVKKKMLRNSLRNIEHQLSEFNNFIRTHRTCIVNIQYINKLNKSFNSYWISLDKTKETIPVSRQYLMIVKDLL